MLTCARYELEQTLPESVQHAQELFQRAIDRDRSYAAAYAGLGSARFNSKFTDQKGSQETWLRAGTGSYAGGSTLRTGAAGHAI